MISAQYAARMWIGNQSLASTKPGTRQVVVVARQAALKPRDSHGHHLYHHHSHRGRHRRQHRRPTRQPSSRTLALALAAALEPARSRTSAFPAGPHRGHWRYAPTPVTAAPSLRKNDSQILHHNVAKAATLRMSPRAPKERREVVNGIINSGVASHLGTPGPAALGRKDDGMAGDSRRLHVHFACHCRHCAKRPSSRAACSVYSCTTRSSQCAGVALSWLLSPHFPPILYRGLFYGLLQTPQLVCGGYFHNAAPLG